jgi:hypothetical protein
MSNCGRGSSVVDRGRWQPIITREGWKPAIFYDLQTMSNLWINAVASAIEY